jgi:hypothetical protein
MSAITCRIAACIWDKLIGSNGRIGVMAWGNAQKNRPYFHRVCFVVFSDELCKNIFL